MNMLIEELQNLSTHPLSWALVGAMTLLSGFAIAQYVTCPLMRGKTSISEDQAEQARQTTYRPGLRFGLMMIVGIALALTGLIMIADGTHTAIALVLVVAGILLVQTEPARLSIREYTTQVLARRDASHEAQEEARYRLRSGYRDLAVRNVTLLVGVAAALLAF